MHLIRLIYNIFFRSAHRSRLRLSRTILAKEEALTSKALVEARAIQQDSIRKGATAFAFSYGLVVVFCYCFFDIKFFPSGLSTGDVLFFLFAALGLGLASLFCTALGMSAFLPASLYESCRPKGDAAKGSNSFANITWFVSPAFALLTGTAAIAAIGFGVFIWLFQLGYFVSVCVMGSALSRSQGRSLDRFDFPAYGIGYLILAPLLCHVILSLGESQWIILAIILVAGLSGALGMDLLDSGMNTIPADSDDRRRYALRLLVAKIFFGIALLPALVIADLRLLVFTQLGVRTHNTAVSLDKHNLERLQSAADTAGIQLNVCRGEGDHATVAPIDVLWHASGTRSLIRLGKNQGIDVELKTDGLNLIRGKFERCIELKESLLFSSGTAKLVAGDDIVRAGLDDELTPILTDIKQGWKVKTVKIIGHADPMLLPLNGNDALAKERADIVKALLMKNSEFIAAVQSKSKVDAVSASARQPIKLCNTNESAAVQRACNEANRRVEIRFRLERTTEKQPAA